MKSTPAIREVGTLALFLLGVVGGGLTIGYLATPGEWFAALAKPPFEPPGWIFAPVWTVLYVLIAFAGYHMWSRDRHGPAMKLWGVQLALNFIWSPLFFVSHQVGLALVVIVLLLGTIVAFMRAAWERERPAAWLFIPYALWVVFAAVLNGAILALN